MRTTFGAEREIDAPADVIYHLISDYHEHHRPEGFLPPAFTDQEVLRGGVGAGTELRYTMTTGGRPRTVTSKISEPEPGRRLVEISPGIETTFTVEPTGDGARVRFDTILDADGLEGVSMRLFAWRLLRPIYEDELSRLEEAARAHSPAAAGSARPS
jgi:hypothetical protein